MAGIAGLAESLDLLMRFGTSEAGEVLAGVTEQLCEELRSAGAEVASDRGERHRSGIVAFTLPGPSTTETRKALLDREVVVRERAGRLRASPHVYTNDEDIDRLVEGLKAAKRG